MGKRIMEKSDKGAFNEQMLERTMKMAVDIHELLIAIKVSSITRPIVGKNAYFDPLSPEHLGHVNMYIINNIRWWTKTGIELQGTPVFSVNSPATTRWLIFNSSAEVSKRCRRNKVFL
jgi:hypothetical protein